MTHATEVELTQALDRWERDGGRTVDINSDDSTARGESMPPGYCAQPAWTVTDPAGLHQFNRVYGPARPTQGRFPITVRILDEGRSYWRSVGAKSSEVERLDFNRARELLGRRLTFEQFSSPSESVEVRRLCAAERSRRSTPPT